MKSFIPSYLDNLSVPLSLTILLDFCAQHRGKEELWKNQKPEVLSALKEQSIISSTESSNRIEGVVVERGRLKPLVTGKAIPKDRSELEIIGYKKALEWIHNKHQEIEITPETIKQFHLLAQEGNVSDAGKWKKKNNEIIEINKDGTSEIRFTPTEAKDVPSQISSLCLSYKDSVSNGKFPDLLLISTFVFDFLCIHPFRDGNGRVSRLLTNLLLYKHDMNLCKYISIEKIVEDTKESYYSALKESSSGWHDSKHDLLPFWLYFTRTIKVSYERLGSKFEIESSFHGGKSHLVKKAILAQTESFTLADIMALEPSVSRELIQKTLTKMREEGVLELKGKGRGAFWKKKT